MRPRVAFLHMPKAAGMAVIAALRDSLEAAGEAHRVCPASFDRALFGGFAAFDRVAPHVAAQLLSRPVGRGEFDVMMGHFGLSTLRAAFDDGDVVVLLREPRSRLLSQYDYWCSWDVATHDSWSPFESARRAATESWEEFLLDESIAAQTDNLMVRLLTWPDPRLPDDGFIDAYDLDGLVADALASLARLGHVDVIERGADAWVALGDWLDAPLEVGTVNETPRDRRTRDWSTEFTDGATVALAARTRGDRALWDAAATRAGLTPADALALADTTFTTHLTRLVSSPHRNESGSGMTRRRWGWVRGDRGARGRSVRRAGPR